MGYCPKNGGLLILCVRLYGTYRRRAAGRTLTTSRSKSETPACCSSRSGCSPGTGCTWIGPTRILQRCCRLGSSGRRWPTARSPWTYSTSGGFRSGGWALAGAPDSHSRTLFILVVLGVSFTINGGTPCSPSLLLDRRAYARPQSWLCNSWGITSPCQRGLWRWGRSRSTHTDKAVWVRYRLYLSLALLRLNLSTYFRLLIHQR